MSIEKKLAQNYDSFDGAVLQLHKQDVISCQSLPTSWCKSA
jgi:hypothetical protein